MVLPIGEFILFSAALIGWTEQSGYRHRLYGLLLAWIGGSVLEGLFLPSVIWHWNWARLAVMLLFWLWVRRQAHRRFLPLLLTGTALIVQDIFLLNEPGVIAGDQLIFSLAAVLVASLTAGGYWEMLAAVAGAWFFNQLAIGLIYIGTDVINYTEIPDAFAWHFEAAVCSAAALFRATAVKMKKTRTEKTQEEKD
ncbi:MAG: hypothetical protein LBT22_08775 [Peptococcaceae bacterium]|jgi:hypothetical protein|nr:hypothetical protein [Peptococcaceae bacterium]